MKKLFLAAAAMLCFGVGQAQAATVNPGDTFCESKAQLTLDFICDVGSRDLGQTAAATPITFLGDGLLYGWVRDAAGFGQRFRDSARIELTQDSFVSFKLLNFSKAFTGTLTLGSAIGPTLFGDGGIYELAPVRLSAGTYVFTFDAALPDERKVNESEYKLYVEVVPLPASGLLVLGGLAAVGAMRRRKTRA